MDSAPNPVARKKRVLAPYMFGHKPVLIKPPKEKKNKEPIQEVQSNQRAGILNRLLYTVEKVYKIPKTQPLPDAHFVDPNDESSIASAQNSNIDDGIGPINENKAEPSADESDQDEEVENSSEPEDENETSENCESPAASSKSPSVSSEDAEYDSEPAADKSQLAESDKQEEEDENSSEPADEESEASDDCESPTASSKSPSVSSEGEYDSEPAAEKRQLAESDQEEEESETSGAGKSAAASSTSPSVSSSEEEEESKPSAKQKKAKKERKIKEKRNKVQWKKPVSSEDEYDSEPAPDIVNRKGMRQLPRDPLHEIRRNIHPPANLDEIRQRLLSPLGGIQPQNERSHQERTEVDDVGSEVNDEPHPCEMRGCRNNEDEPIRPPTAPSYTAWWERPLRDEIKRRKPDFDAKKRWSRKRIPAPPINFEDPRRMHPRHCCIINQ